ncbi:hypothetical protein AM493_10345 [Flavobacterium akiainvivens]|uniref:Quercetin 2,3-dioxygenase C-terminal cupin domain-containing protein n=1 Tax=Flavobacterium akiainvivens TaxID=1202724 RepID=A0A0M8MB39_9FLAO|nr:hypothetical protein [Flavobacterium akiainvivens]KOS06385.1 hypothetical protein AM493_10345 [Flavobacterium akiainvivens]SFQ14698.1 hypothetical protein SAMN05444144_101293 [Flavobacterium akiainvivens]
MKRQSTAIIYKAQQRGHFENEQQRLLSTFNFGTYHAENREPFGSLSVLNDEVLAPGFSITRSIQEGTSALIIPLTGGIKVTHETTEFESFPDEALILPAGEISIKNPYEAELVNFLYIELNTGTSGYQNIGFKLDTKNTLLPFIKLEAVKGYIGIFEGRQEAFYTLQPGHGLFVFIINGAFETEGRLLEERDALALWNTNEAEIEALSNNAALLLFEVKI